MSGAGGHRGADRGAGRGVVIVGATSAIARAIARDRAQKGERLALAGRDLEECERLAADLRTRYDVGAVAIGVDLEEMDAHAFADDCARALGGAIDDLVLCQGFMAEQADAQRDPALVRRTFGVNLTSVVELCEAIAPTMRTPGATITVLSSVAGDRGRPSNHIYGASKAGVDAYLEGLGARLRAGGIFVCTVKPGFTDTAMTWGLDGMFLVAPPEKVARDVARALERGRYVVYTPWFWRWIMLIIRSVPGPLFRRASL
jgi:decaprenylphospho-beta-D-erythro-pentofuranosid-2-ulose 2-reductase